MMATRKLFSVFCQNNFWISLFVSTYIFIVLIWLSPQTPVFLPIKNKITNVAVLIGLDQNWALFSPDLRSTNLYHIALITFKDGSRKIYEWPRMDRLNIYEKFCQEKYRKMFIDCLAWPNYQIFWPSVARFVARANANKDNPPVCIALAYFWSDVPSTEHWVNQEQVPEPFKFYNYFIYRVHPEDLQ